MTDRDLAFARFMSELRAGNPRAVKRLLSEYAPHVTRTVRRRLNWRLRSKFDEGDFVQSVWRAFFSPGPHFGTIRDPKELAAFLTALARNRTVDEVRRRLRTRRHRVADERSLAELSARSEEQIVTRSPTASQVAIAKEAKAEIEETLPRKYLAIVQLRASGETCEEIARRLEISERTVRRVLARLDRSSCLGDRRGERTHP